MKMDEVMNMGRKLKYFFDKQIIVHISFEDGSFYNGLIIDFNADKEIIVLRENKLGEIPVLFEEIIRVGIFREVGE